MENGKEDLIHTMPFLSLSKMHSWCSIFYKLFHIVFRVKWTQPGGEKWHFLVDTYTLLGTNHPLLTTHQLANFWKILRRMVGEGDLNGAKGFFKNLDFFEVTQISCFALLYYNMLNVTVLEVIAIFHFVFIFCSKLVRSNMCRRGKVKWHCWI